MGHLEGPVIQDSSGQLAELIVHITSTRVDLYSHQILFGGSSFNEWWVIVHTSSGGWYNDTCGHTEQTAKLVSPRSSISDEVGRPVKNIGGPIKLLYIYNHV